MSKYIVHIVGYDEDLIETIMRRDEDESEEDFILSVLETFGDKVHRIMRIDDMVLVYSNLY